MKLRTVQILLALVVSASTALVSAAQNSASDAVQSGIHVAGKWTISMQEGGHHGGGKQTMNIQQDGHKISGTIKDQQGDAPLQGSLDGNNISFSVNKTGHHGAMTLEYHGTVQGDSMSGTLQGPMGEMSWSAKRKAE